MAYGWHDSLGPGGPSLSDPNFEEPRRRRGPPRSRWLGAASACFLVALGTAVLVTQSMAVGMWFILAGIGVSMLIRGLLSVRRITQGRRHIDLDDAGEHSASSSLPRPVPAVEPSWWLQPMSHRQAAAVISLPFGATGIAFLVAEPDFVPSAWTAIAGGSLAVIYLVVAYRRSNRPRRQRRFRVEEDDSSKKWRRYRWPRGARTLR